MATSSIYEWMLKTNMTVLKNQARLGVQLTRVINMMANGNISEPNCMAIVEEVAQIMSETESLTQELTDIRDKVAKDGS